MRIKRTVYLRGDIHVRVEADLPGRKQPLGVSVYKDKPFGEAAYQPTQINWSALGTVSVETADLYAQLLTRAVREAHHLDLLIEDGWTPTSEEVEE